ncbi:MAG: MbnP family protein [Bacteroidota bacterium]
MRNFLSVICLVSLTVLVSSFYGDEVDKASRKITLAFHHQVGNDALVLGNPVKNILGETISVEKFKYYVSNFSVTNDKGVTTKLPVQYFLIDEADPLSKNINLSIPENIIVTRISFLLGVDSIKNVSGIQTGALDPLKGMFWTWNSGYIMAKMEGVSESAATGGNHFTYDIGGFRKGMNTTKRIDLNIDNKEKNLQEVHINADINRWFKGSSELKIAETPICHSPGALAMRIADNYSTMFSINSIR